MRFLCALSCVAILSCKSAPELSLAAAFARENESQLLPGSGRGRCVATE